MDAEMKFKLRQLLIKHEGYRKYPYLDSKGKITIGIGWNLTDVGIDDIYINSKYEEMVDYFFKFLSQRFEWFDNIDDPRKIALIDMCYNLGIIPFTGFEKMLFCMGKQDWQGAHDEILNSDYAKEVGQRAIDIATIILTGVING